MIAKTSNASIADDVAELRSAIRLTDRLEGSRPRISTAAAGGMLDEIQTESIARASIGAATGVEDPVSVWQQGLKERKSLGWGPKFVPPVTDGDDFNEFKRIVRMISKVLPNLRQVLSGDSVEDGTPDVAEIDSLLDSLYRCKWGVGESLKMIVVAIQAQIRNCRIERGHLELLLAIGAFLTSAYLIDESAVDHVHVLVEKAGLNPYRGTLSDDGFIKKYRILEVSE